MPPRIAFLLSQPTQFDAPFFRFAHASGKAAVTVLYLNADPSDPELAHKLEWGIDLFSGYPHKMAPARGRFAWLSRELARGRYDRIVLNGYTQAPYAAALAIARLHGIRAALRIDSVLFNAGGGWRRARKRAVLAALDMLFDRFLATGTLTREYLEHFGIAPGKIALFPYLVDAAAFVRPEEDRARDRAALRGRLGIPAGARVILAVAKMNARETPWDLVAALEGLDRPGAWTVLVGDGEQLAALQERVESRRMTHVAFAGYVPYPQLRGFYAAADVFVHAAADEPWGVSVHEAIACGLPVIASSRVGAGRDLVVPGRNGFIYEIGDVAQLRTRLREALDGLDPAALREENARLLDRWGHAAMWDEMLGALA